MGDFDDDDIHLIKLFPYIIFFCLNKFIFFVEKYRGWHYFNVVVCNVLFCKIMILVLVYLFYRNYYRDFDHFCYAHYNLVV